MIDWIRLLNLFPQNTADPGQIPMDMSKELPIQNQAQDQLKSFMGGMPKRENFPPSMGQKIGGILASLGTGRLAGIAGGQPIGFIGDPIGGLQAQSAILNKPYNEALSDWNMKLKPLSELADSEGRANTNTRLLRSQLLTDQNKDLDRTSRESMNTARIEGQNERLTKTLEQKNEYLKLRNKWEEHKGNRLEINDKGQFVLIGKDGAIIETGIDSNKLSDEDKLDLQHRNRLSEIEAQGSNRLKAIGAQGEQTRTTAKEKSAIKSLTPSAQNMARLSKVKEILTRIPEWADYIEAIKDPNGKMIDFTVKYDGTPLSQQIIDEIYGDSKKDIRLPEESSAPKVPKVPEDKTSTRPEDQKTKDARSKVEAGYVLISDGKSFGQVKVSDVSKLPAGWGVVK